MKQGVKIGIIVVALGGAGISYFVFGGSRDQFLATGDESKTLWMCQGCNEVIEISPKQVLDLATESGGSAPPYICSKCKEKKLYHALKCDKCSTVFFPAGVPDASGVCPKCNPDVKAQPPKPEDEEVVPQQPEGSEQPDIGPVRKAKKNTAA